MELLFLLYDNYTHWCIFIQFVFRAGFEPSSKRSNAMEYISLMVFTMFLTEVETREPRERPRLGL